MRVRNFLFPLLAFGALAFGQDRTDVLRETNVEAGDVRVRFLPDSGCELTAIGEGTTDAGTVRQVVAVYPFNGARCGTLQTAALRAVKRELGVGNGTAP